MASNEVTPTEIPRALPKYVRVAGTPRFSANQLRMLRAATGQSMEAVMNDGANVIQAFVWFELRREGYDPSWEDAGEVEIEFADETVDPTEAAIVIRLRRFAGFGV